MRGMEAEDARHPVSVAGIHVDVGGRQQIAKSPFVLAYDRFD